MIENYESLNTDSLKHLCQVTYHSNMNRECQIYLDTIINKDDKLDKEMQILLPANFKKIFYLLKNQIRMLNDELKKLTKFSKKKNKKPKNNEKQKEENESLVNIGYIPSSFRRNSAQKEEKKEEESKIKNIDNEFKLDPEKDKELISFFLSELRATIANFNTDIKHKIIDFHNTLDKLIALTNNEIEKAYYLKLKGDFYRYAIEIYVTPDDKNKKKNQSEESYVKGIDLLNNISFKEPVKLSLYLNYAVLLFEEKKQKEDAIDFLNFCINGVSQIENELNDEGKQILSKIKDNKVIWEFDNSKKLDYIDNEEEEKEEEEEEKEEEEEEEEEEREENLNNSFNRENQSEKDKEIEDNKEFI